MRLYNVIKFIYLSVAAFHIYLPGKAVASIPPQTGLSQLIQEALHNNPQIKAARDRFLAAKNVIPQSRSLPDPTVNLGYMQISTGGFWSATPTNDWG